MNVNVTKRVSCGSGWSVPCVSIQLTLSQTGTLRGSVSCGSGQLGMRSRVSFLADPFSARLYYAAFKLDPSKSGRKMVAWLRYRSGAAPTPMEMETVSAGVRELRPGKKPRAEAAGAALSVA